MKTATWVILSALCTSPSRAAQIANTGPLPSQSQVEEGKRVFAMSCSVGYCHGLEGRAGKGPRLRGRVFSKSYLYTTIQKGIPNSSMPAWQGRLSDRSIDAVVAYILSISQQKPDAGTSEGMKESAPSKQPVSEQAKLGKALFFDPMKDRNCGVCHQIDGSGTAIAAAFTNLARTKHESFLRQILDSPGGKTLKVTTAEGEIICGIDAGESRSAVRIYDLASSGPPVLRTVDSGSVRKTEPCVGLNAHQANSRLYSTPELMSIAAFLRSFSGPDSR